MTHKEEFYIKSYHVDFNRDIKISSLMLFFQEAAWASALSLGFGYDDMSAKGLYWVMSRMRFELLELPSWGDVVRVETWPVGVEGLFFRRDFEIYIEDRLIARGVAPHIVLDSKTGRPKRDSDIDIPFPRKSEKFAVESIPTRLLFNCVDVVARREVRYSDLDFNDHVNNTIYFDWVSDCFDKEFYSNYTISSFQLEFLSETHMGDHIELRIGKITDNHFQHEAYNIDSGKVVFKAETLWINRPNA